nr:TPA_asm: polymerase PB1 [Orthomyxo-like virus forcipomyiae]
MEQYEDDFQFQPVKNSLFESMFCTEPIPRSESEVKLPPLDLLDNLSTVSMLYIYTNPAPVGNGVPAPKIAETVIRSMDFNLNSEEEKWRIIGDKYRISRNRWVKTDAEGKPAPFPVTKTTGNWKEDTIKSLHDKFGQTCYETIKNQVDRTIEKYMVKNVDILTKGRQTYDPLTRSSLPCAQAFNNMMKFFENNLGERPITLMDFIRLIFKLSDKTEIQGYEFETTWETYNKTIRGRGTSRFCKVRRKKVNRKSKLYKGEEAKDYFVEIASSFCGYIKHLERGKKDRRAIASPNIILRAFLEIVEDFHLELGKNILSSTISVGGDKKKNKILAALSLISESYIFQKTAQSTQDATKWNECLSPELFAVFAIMMFDKDVRCSFSKQSNENIDLFYNICLTSHTLLALKRIHIGEMPIVSDEFVFSRPEFTEENIEMFNEKTQKWMKSLIPFKIGPYIESSNGMLMGMHNALSTTVGLAAMDNGNKQMISLRSSDDSSTVYAARNPEELRQILQTEMFYYKASGINLSVEKTLVCPVQYAEFTSWYIDKDFVSQWGSDTSSLRPGGKNPFEDMFSGIKQTSVSQTRLECNPFGGMARIRLISSNVKRLYRITDKRQSYHDNVSDIVRLHADGGFNLYLPSRTHLEEVALKSSYATTNEEKEYIKRIRTTDNPFVSSSEEEFTWSKETGGLAMASVSVPKNLFCTRRRTNRTLHTEKGIKQAQVERANSVALDIVRYADRTNFIRPTPSMIKCRLHALNNYRIQFEAIKDQLTEEEIQDAHKAIAKLSLNQRQEGFLEEGFEIGDNGTDYFLED